MKSLGNKSWTVSGLIFECSYSLSLGNPHIFLDGPAWSAPRKDLDLTDVRCLDDMVIYFKRVIKAREAKSDMDKRKKKKEREEDSKRREEIEGAKRKRE